MSHNQPRGGGGGGDGQGRRTGRSGNFGGGYRNKSAGTGGPPPPSTTRSFRKTSNGHRVNQASTEATGMAGFTPAASPVPVHASAQNGAHPSSLTQPQPQQPISSVVAPDAVTDKPTNAPLSKDSAQAAPRLQPSHLSSFSKPADSTSASVVAAKGDSSKACAVQFGSINFGMMNGLSIPARTNSAPPNLDEQRQNQALQGVIKSVPPHLPLPPASKHQQRQQPEEVPQQPQPPPLVQKDAPPSSQSNIGKPQAPATIKREAHATPPSVASAAAPPRAPVPSMAGMPIPMTFHPQQAQVSYPFGAPGPQMQPPSLVPSTIQIPIAMPGSNAPHIPQQMLYSNHAMQQQSLLHQSQNLGYAPPSSHTLHPPLGNLNVSMQPQYPPQQAGNKYISGRKSNVKVTITDPDTREEVKLDGSGQRQAVPVVQQSQPVPSFPSLSYYVPPSSFGGTPMFFPGANPLAGNQISNTQTARYGFPQAVPPVSYVGQPMLNVSGGNLEQVGPTSAPMQITVRPPVGMNVERHTAHSVTISLPPSKSEGPKQGKSGDGTSNLPNSSDVDKHTGKASSLSSIKGTRLETPTVLANHVTESVSRTESVHSKNFESVPRADSYKDHGKKLTQTEPPRSSEQLQSSILPSDDGRLSSYPKDSLNSAPAQQKTEDGGNCRVREVEFGTSSQMPPSHDGVIKTSLEAAYNIAKLSPTEGKCLDHAEESSSWNNKDDGTALGIQIEIKMSKSEDAHLEEVMPAQDEIDDKTAHMIDGVALVSSECSAIKSEESGSNEVTQQQQQLQASDESVRDKIEESNSSELSMDDATALADSEATPSAATLNSTETANSVQFVPEIDHDTEPSISKMLSDEVTCEQIQRSDSTGKEHPGIAEASVLRLVPKEKPSVETARAKVSGGKKKKRKEMLSKADAAGSSDLYNAYKGPEEKSDDAVALESIASSSTTEAVDSQPDESENDIHKSEGSQSKLEPDDWEEATDISIPKLKPSELGDLGYEANKLATDAESECINGKKYTRDFLLTFSHQYTDLPVGFHLGNDLANLMSGLAGKSYAAERDARPPSRGDRRTVGPVDDSKWTRSVSFSPGRDPRIDIDAMSAMNNFRPQVSPSMGRSARGQPPIQFPTGILQGPGQASSPYVNLPRNGSDADKWHHALPMQRGLIPSPATPLQMMHKADKRYEVGKVSDEEEAKQRRLKAILNKLTPQNFEKLFAQVKEMNIDNRVTLTGVISQIFDKALTEPTFCEMYANFCSHLAGVLPDFSEDNEKITFKRLLLNKCQEEFERGEREEAEADKPEEGEIEKSEAREEKRLRARRRMLGNIRLIGELYKKRMLTERIMHECIKKLLGQHQNPDAEDIEALCKLMSTIGEMIDHPKAKDHMDAYFDIMQKMTTNQVLSSRHRFMLRDTIDLRKNRWQQRIKVEGPKKIEEVHRDAAQEKSQPSRGGRGPVINSIPRRGALPDYGPRGSTSLISPGSQQAGLRAQVRSFGAQDVRFDERNQFENRTMPLPPSQRPGREESITLGPQGGLARGMSIRGQQPTVPSDVPIGDHRRMTPAGPNGYNAMPDKAPHAREDTGSGIIADKSSHGVHDDRSTSGSSRSVLTPSNPNSRSHGSLTSTHDTRGGTKSFSEEQLRDKSMSAIKEFYSANDADEVVLCIEELNAPSFLPSVVSLWVTDSFERKDLQRDLLAGLLVNLCKNKGDLLSHMQLIQGLASVLSTLEDAVNDAPRASEFLGRLLAKFIVESVVSLTEIGHLIREGGEEPGYLVENGLAADVLASTLESVKLEKGESFLHEVIATSNLKLGEFGSPQFDRSKLDTFI